MKRVLHNLLTNWDYFFIGLELGGMGCLMLYDRNFFFWPPEWAPVFNDVRLDTIGIITGIWLMAYALDGRHSNTLISIPLAVGAAFVMALMCGEGVHIWFMHVFRLKLAFWLELCLLFQIIKVAFVHNPDLKIKDKKKDQ